MPSTEYSLRVPSTFLHENQGAEKTLLIFLHGFADSAASFLRRAYPEPDPAFEILAPNGPFPQPQRMGGEWKDAYAWYFANLSENRVIIPPSVAADAIAGLVKTLGLENRPKIVCGFSQGGYFMPHLAHKLKNVQRLIAMGAGFHPEYFERFGMRLPVSAIHGSADDVIPLAEAQGDFERLGSWNAGGKFVVVPGMSHAIDDAGRAALQEVLSAKNS